MVDISIVSGGSKATFNGWPHWRDHWVGFRKKSGRPWFLPSVSFPFKPSPGKDGCCNKTRGDSWDILGPNWNSRWGFGCVPQWGIASGYFGAVQLFLLQWNANLANIDPVLTNQQTKLIHSAGSPRWSIALRLDTRPPLLVDVVLPVPIGGLPPIPTYNFIKPYWTSESYTTSYDTACIW